MRKFQPVLGFVLPLLLAFLAQPLLAQASPQQIPAKAQVQRLTITVTDENGTAVSAALVLLKSAVPANPGRCETDFAGRCDFSKLSAGTYELEVEKSGFYATFLPGIQVGVTSNVDVTLSHQQEVREVVNVTESPPVIDPAQVSSKEELSGLQVIDIPYPGTHDYRNALNFIPGVVQDSSGQPHVAGAETYQTLTLLDGFNVTQPANGQLLVHVSTDAFRSITVQPSREPAEFGKASGGLLGLNTRIGDDHYRVIATDFIPSVQNQKGLQLDSWTPRFTFSGPIREGKMWFFDAMDGQYDNIIVPQLPSGADADHVWNGNNLAKVQTNLTSRNILTTSFLFNYLNDQHFGLSAISPLSATPEDTEFAYVGTVKDQHYFGGGELLETGFNFDQYNLDLTPLGSAPYFIASGVGGGNYYLDQLTHARRYQGVSNLYLAPREWHGRHDIKLGIDLDRLRYDAQFSRQPVSYWPQPSQSGPCPTNSAGIPLIPSPCSRYSVFSGGSLSTTYNFETSGYIQDRWLVANHLLIEPGVRFDWDEIVRNVLLSPRLAGTYVLDNAGNTKLSAGVGLVYDATPLFLIARPYTGQRLDYFFASNGDLTEPPVLTTFSVNHNALQAPRFLNSSIALEKKLPAALFLKVEFQQRQGTRDFVYNTPNNQAGGNFILANTRDDRYNAFQIALRRSFGKRYIVMGSYTRSSAHSNQVLDFNLDNPIFSPQAAGPFPWDVPNRFLSWGFLPFFKLPILHSVDLAYSAELRNGFPFDVYNNQQQLVEPPGSRRFPAYFSLNLHLEKRFSFLGYYWAVRGGFNDITDRSNPVVVNADINSPQFLTFSGYDHRAFTTRIRFLGRK